MNIVGYYQFDKEEFSIAMVLKEFWEEHGLMSDSGEEEEFVPDGFFERNCERIPQPRIVAGCGSSERIN